MERPAKSTKKTLDGERLRALLEEDAGRHSTHEYVTLGTGKSSARPVSRVQEIVREAGIDATATDVDEAIRELGGERLKHTNINHLHLAVWAWLRKRPQPDEDMYYYPKQENE